MIIYYNSNEKLKNTLEELILMHTNFHLNLKEDELYQFLLDAEETLGIDIRIDPEVDLKKPRPNFGWKFSTLRYLSNTDEFSMFLPETEMLGKNSNVIDIQDADENDIRMTKAELLRRLKGIEIEFDKLKKDIEGGL